MLCLARFFIVIATVAHVRPGVEALAQGPRRLGCTEKRLTGASLSQGGRSHIGFARCTSRCIAPTF